MGHDIKFEKKRAGIVFGALLVLTVVTVAVADLKVGIGMAVLIALTIATLKASLVATFFMHLIAERKFIYVLLGFTAFFCISMILLFILGQYSIYEGLTFTSDL